MFAHDYTFNEEPWNIDQQLCVCRQANTKCQTHCSRLCNDYKNIFWCVKNGLN